METPTPDTTPSYEELQQRLEASNRNIQNMQEQQQQLLKLQNAAKQHLCDMEKLRQQATGLSFPSGSNGDGVAPDYQSVGQIQSDMASLVGRMKNLTNFIQNQNELSTLMGDDGPEIRAEQEALQKKLESLRNQRDEMRNLVSELQDVNRSAEESAKEAKQRQCEQEKDVLEPKPEPSPQAINKTAAGTERKVPLEYSRNVAIELTQQPQRQQKIGNLQSESEADVEEEEEQDEEDEEQRKATAALIKQKVTDIEAMKSQLKRLKDMMETVNLIEAHTAKDPKTIGRPTTSVREVPITFHDREQTPVPAGNSNKHCDDNHDDGNREDIFRKFRMLNEVTSDLRAQAESLQAEKNRIHALKAEIEKRQNQAAAAVQLGEDALKRNSLTPTPTPASTRSHEERWNDHLKAQHERDQLKAEYDAKKREFELLCKRLDQEDDNAKTNTTKNRRQDIVSEADDEAEEDNNDSDYAASSKFVPTSAAASNNNNNNNGRQEKPMENGCINQQLGNNVKEALNSSAFSATAANNMAQAANSTIDGASMEAASMQSGSSRSYSIPPPMFAMGTNFCKTS